MSWNRSEENASRANKPGTRALSVGWTMGLVALALVAIAVTLFALWSDDVSSEPRPNPEPGQPVTILSANSASKVVDSVKKVLPKGIKGKTPDKSRRKRKAVPIQHLTGDDLRMVEAVQKALDADDFEKTRAAAMSALSSTNGEVRLEAIDALGWFGAQALPELAGTLSDADEDVRQAAENQFESALQDLDSPGDRFKITVALLGALSDEDQLSNFGSLADSAASEFIDEDDDERVQSERRVAVVQALSDVIQKSKGVANVTAAKEAYENVTGNEWRGVEEAERYLRDPDNYELPEDREEEKEDAADSP